MGTDGGEEFILGPPDVRAIEGAFGDHTMLGGTDVEHPAPTAGEAVAAVLLPGRVVAVTAFLPRLRAAFVRACSEHSAAPVLAALEDASAAQMSVVLPQLLFRRSKQHAHAPPHENTVAIAALVAWLQAPLPTDAVVEVLHQVVDDLDGGLLLTLNHDALSVSIVMNGSGMCALFIDGGWRMVHAVDGATLQARATEALEAGDIDAALVAVEAAIALEPDSLEAHALAGSVFFAADRAAEAFAWCADRSDGETRVEMAVNAATVWSAAGDDDRANAMLVRMTVEAPTSPTAWYRLGLAHVKAQRFADSLEALARLFALSPEHALGHYTAACALTLRDDNDVDAAIDHIAKAIAADDSLAAAIAADDDFAAISTHPRFVSTVGVR